MRRNKKIVVILTIALLIFYTLITCASNPATNLTDITSGYNAKNGGNKEGSEDEVTEPKHSYYSQIALANLEADQLDQVSNSKTKVYNNVQFIYEKADGSGLVYTIKNENENNNNNENKNENKDEDGKEIDPDTNQIEKNMTRTNVNTEGQGQTNGNKKEKFSVKLKPFFYGVFELLSDSTPNTTIGSEYGSSGILMYKGIEARYDGEKLTEEFLGKSLIVTDENIRELKKAHHKITDNLPSFFPANTYSGDGIVIVGGGAYSLLALLVVETVRKTGCTLPIEVFIPLESNPDKEFCENLLPKFNAKCISIEDVLDRDILANWEFKGYQYKSLALIASSFARVLLLDADNYPVQNVENLFTNEPFISTGLVLWPDYWRRVTSPAYYKAADITLGNKWMRFGIDTVTNPNKYSTGEEDPYSEIPLHDREDSIPDGTTESGQILIDKYAHAGTILLSLYYNLNGPTHYYPLLSQGSSGEGDKETFLAAATFYGYKSYQVKKEVNAHGYYKPNNGGFQGVAMLQHNPIRDYELLQEVTKLIQEDNSLDYDKYKLPNFFTRENSELLFVHANYPKFEPLQLASSNALTNEIGEKFRMYNSQDILMFGYDFELKQFEYMKYYICEIQFEFAYLSEGIDKAQLCNYIEDHLLFLHNTTTEAKD
ncbi:hypothetical protein PACTADRAFT_51433 [Pachysolen tannophilus NRRL Y-2460]|uniref:Alpha-1,2-mannosyltransferase MNN2 n=1 Tax=Pachysolen tannophilus NRRL Y-2460 TaxID=669874 RepID=A0A1E4TPI1_PACTA|nr:hypothetical protein PACTADRAFT_51433 [Pachysolen tannophilus NRRL Y-2460]